ncbi:4'-phosphopantetheinyl transferase superfamily protein (plasmid) [Streptomyces sp. NBC_00536]|uniref:4'-phosphopantetheinyl transferase family protein n=1 Tax=Streptomyces sp. NBC_00536 TaxID=2975769 RepID=UPI002E81CB23|nr:4'-phosphopantetheinyl transferase superfamily protein [Streptomyces sp. NBC_00536]WUC84273.1 4'-phosphopantetheinyl transferase superfamily protein [Streptomyces sp. NBC_00536]
MSAAAPGYGPGPAPLAVAGPDGPWDELGDRLDDDGRAVVCTTWGQWLTAALLDPGLRPLLGHDWPRYRQGPTAAGRMRFAVSRLVMKYTAASALNVPVGALDLGYRPGGRPVLRGLGGELEVSLAHTDELIVVGVSRTGPIGVDAEPVGRQISFELLREHVCTPAEDAELAALPEEERRVRLLRMWTLKEAYTKALGHGMRRSFAGFGFAYGAGAGSGDGAGAPQVVPGDDAGGRWSFATHLVQDRYLVSEAHRRVRAGSAPKSVPETAPPVDAGSRSGAGPLEERGPEPLGLLRFLDR